MAGIIFPGLWMMILRVSEDVKLPRIIDNYVAERQKPWKAVLCRYGEKASGQSLSFDICNMGQQYNHIVYSRIIYGEVYEVIRMVPTHSRCLADDGSELLMTITKAKFIIPQGTCILLTCSAQSVGRSRL